MLIAHLSDRKGPVRIIGLDVTVPGEHHGEATEDACAWLGARLAEEPRRSTIVIRGGSSA